jgi:glycosyltransferase involved in cell wall biosynthesis
MNLIHVIPNLKNGGAENMLVNLALQLCKRGYKQSIITFENSKGDFNFSKLDKQILVLNLKTEKKKSMKILKETKAPVLLWMYASIFKFEFLKLRYKLNNQYFWNIRHSDFGSLQIKQKAGLYFLGIVSNIANSRIIYCSFKSKSVHENYFFKEIHSCVIQNRLAKLPPAKINKLDHDFILFVGRNNPQKGPEHLKEIVFNVLKAQSSFKAVILGSGWNLDYFNEEIQDRIKLINSAENVFDYYGSAKCLLYTSLYGEGYPNIIAEGMIMGVPIVGYDSGDFNLMIQNYDLGETVSNKYEFVSSVLNIINNQSSDQQRTNAINKISPELHFDKTINSYTDILF